jgi:dinuclear metal center YbgI/SA1388 family protein
MESFAPLSLSESWDNTGLLIEAPYPRKNSRVLFLTIDLTQKVVEEAIKNPHVGMIIAYHPPLFASFKRLQMRNEKQSIALQCAASGISVYSPHTCLDNCPDGINDWLASGLGSGTTNPIKPNETLPGAGVGRIHTLDNPTTVDDITNRIKMHLNLKHVRRALANNNIIKTIAICAGSGYSVLSGVKADLYFTGEMGHHDALSCLANNVNVILCEHSNTERGYLEAVLAPNLLKLIQNDGEEPIDVICSQLDKDPLEII